MSQSVMSPAEIVRLTHGPKHHLFGFHDLAISSRKSGNIVVLAVDRIDRPPLGRDLAEVCILPGDGETGAPPMVLTRTANFNFPQGARQQWLGETDMIVVNEVSADGRAATGVFDGSTGHRLSQLGASLYCADATGSTIYSIDFGRLHRLGGYGHSNVPDQTPDDAEPANNGIFVTSIADGSTRLLVSIADVAKLARKGAAGTAGHFITHLRLNPSNTRLAFLHRYRLADGGEDTRLMTIGIDGSDCRLLGQGFLSHFDWLDDDRVMIWGRKNPVVSDLRNSGFLQNPVARAILPYIKAPLRWILRRKSAMAMNFLVFKDTSDPEPSVVGAGVLTADGHPMLNPETNDWLVTDTYPDSEGYRDLLLFEVPSGQRIDIGRFRMSDEKPAATTVASVAEHIRGRISVAFPPALYGFTRSGLHCDLHPRWFADGRRVAFDSIHEGQRQVYAAEVSTLIGRGETA